MVDEKELNEILNKLFINDEDECVEFKEAKNSFDFDDLGKYFSALSNEATLKRRQYAWLVFGVKDKTHEIVGTLYKNQGGLEFLKRDLPKHTNGINFIDIFELIVNGKRVIMFQIPAAYGLPTVWKGHGYSRDFESLVALNDNKAEQIKNIGRTDWSAVICDDATINDLDKDAIKIAREQFKKKNQNKPLGAEVDSMSDYEFLNKAGLTIDGKITNTAILLLGKDESSKFLHGYDPIITWQLQLENSIVDDYEHFTIPYIKAVDAVLGKIRNLTYRYIVGQMTLFTEEVQKYDPYILRELLNNCIAHQDFRLNGRINIIEQKDQLIFRNEGHFIPESMSKILSEGYVPPYYRNPQLAKAMVNLNMIDTAGSGIKRVFNIQRNRYFPMPDYDLSEDNRVKVTLYGKVIDENYSRLLANNPSISFDEIVLLDRVQKKLPITKNEHQLLKKKGLVEGRYPYLSISAVVASAIDRKTDYTIHKDFGNQFYMDKIVQHIETFKMASRNEIEDLIFQYLPLDMALDKKKNKVKFLLTRLRELGKIENIGSSRKSQWIINQK